MAPGIHRYMSDFDSPKIKINPKSYDLQAQSLAWENQMAYRVYRLTTMMPYWYDRRETPETSTEMLKTTRAPLPIETITIVSTKVTLPLWVYTFIGTAIGLLTLCSYICFIRRCCRKRRAKDSKKGKSIVDFISVQYLGCAKVQFDTELLTENADDIAEEEGSKQSEVKLGKLQYKLEYDFNSNSLTVTVIQAEGLPTLNMSGTSNFYVKVYLLPDKKKKFEAKGRSKTVNPIFNETFTYKDVPYADVMNKTLVFAIIYLNRFSKQNQIGEVKIPLCQVDLSQTIEGWKELQNV